jgi:CheY-like chemotaxis protein
MLRRMLGEQVELATRVGAQAGQVRVDPGQLEQVILNLAVNARDAMPGGGRLTIDTANTELDLDYAASHPGATPGSFVSLTVSDTGVGMDRETQSHLFEPFFTTKPEGKGTGLGLATVYGIVRQSGGSISIYSEVGLGTTVRTYLPRVAERCEVAEPPTIPTTEIPTGSETILLVEDDPAVRSYAGRVLDRLGYTILEAASGSDALGLAAAHARPIDLLVTDIVMPGAQGTDLARQLSAARPGIHVLFISGFDRGTLGEAGLAANMTFLAKPFTSEALGRSVRSALDAANTSAVAG